MDALTATSLLVSLMQQATALGNLIMRAQQENRDITEAELDSLAGGDDLARAALAASIERAKAEGR